MLNIVLLIVLHGRQMEKSWHLWGNKEWYTHPHSD